MSETLSAPRPVGIAEPHPLPVERLSLRSNFAWTLTGNVVYAGCQWGMLVALAKLGTPEWVGQFALGLAVTAPVLLFANLQLRSVQAADTSSEYRFGHYLALRVVMLSVAAMTLGVIILVSGFGRETVLVVMIVGLAKMFESLSDVFYGLLQKHERMDRIAKSMMIKGPVSLAALALGTYFTGSVAAGVGAMAAAWLGVLLLYDLPSGRTILKQFGRPHDKRTNWKPLWDATILRKLAWLAAPLGVVMMLNSLNANIPRYAVQHHLGQWELGIFAALAYLQVAQGTVINALGQSATPRLAAHFAQRQLPAFRRLNLRLLAIGLVIGGAGVLIAALFGRFLLTLLYRPEYAVHSGVFVWLMAGAALSNIAAFLGYGLTAARRFRVQMPLLMAESLILAAMCFYLVPTLGLIGAAVAYAIAKVFLIAFSCIALIRSVRNSDPASRTSGELAHVC